jgi:hypothetical protein
MYVLVSCILIQLINLLHLNRFLAMVLVNDPLSSPLASGFDNFAIHSIMCYTSANQ